MRKKEKVMKNIKIEMLTEMTAKNVVSLFPNVDTSNFKETGVYKIDVGCRGEIDDFDMVANPDLTDTFSVNTLEEINEILLSSTLIDMEDEEELEFATEYAYSDFLVEENFNLYIEGYYEESTTYYVRVAV